MLLVNVLGDPQGHPFLGTEAPAMEPRGHFPLISADTQITIMNLWKVMTPLPEGQGNKYDQGVRIFHPYAFLRLTSLALGFLLS